MQADHRGRGTCVLLEDEISRSTWNQIHAIIPQLPIAPDATPYGSDHSEPHNTNQIMPVPCRFISSSFSWSISTDQAGAKAAATALNGPGLFNGQPNHFLTR